MTPEQLQELVKAIEGMSQIVWQAYLTNAMLDTYIMFALAAAIVVAGTITYKVRDKWFIGDDKWMFWFIESVFAFFFVIFVISAIKHYINPDYYAIQSLLGR